METTDMQTPQNYIIVENKDGTYSAFVNYGIFDTKEDAERSLDYVMSLMGYKIQPNFTLH